MICGGVVVGLGSSWFLPFQLLLPWPDARRGQGRVCDPQRDPLLQVAGGRGRRRVGRPRRPAPTARISLMSSSRSSGKGCDPSPNESDSWSLSPHGEVRTQILAPSTQRSGPRGQPSQRGLSTTVSQEALLESHLEVHDLVGDIGVVSDRQDGRPIRNLYALVCPWVQGKSSPPNSSTSPVLCVDVPAAGVSEAETGSEPKVRPANACWPAFSLRDWRLLSPGVLGEGSLGRLGGVVGLAWGAMPPGLSASRTGPARQRMAAARPCIICSGNPAEFVRSGNDLALRRISSPELLLQPRRCNG